MAYQSSAFAIIPSIPPSFSKSRRERALVARSTHLFAGWAGEGPGGSELTVEAAAPRCCSAPGAPARRQPAAGAPAAPY